MLHKQRESMQMSDGTMRHVDLHQPSVGQVDLKNLAVFVNRFDGEVPDYDDVGV
jgi:hypothetical protein